MGVEGRQLVVPVEGIIVSPPVIAVIPDPVQHLVDGIDIIGQDEKQEQQHQDDAHAHGHCAGDDASVEPPLERL